MKRILITESNPDVYVSLISILTRNGWDLTDLEVKKDLLLTYPNQTPTYLLADTTEKTIVIPDSIEIANTQSLVVADNYKSILGFIANSANVVLVIGTLRVIVYPNGDVQFGGHVLNTTDVENIITTRTNLMSQQGG